MIVNSPRKTFEIRGGAKVPAKKASGSETFPAVPHLMRQIASR